MQAITILSIHDISKSFGLHTVLRQINFSLVSQQRAGLVGANGVGKSTLIKIIMGELEADAGEVRIRPDIRLGYLPQTMQTMVASSLREVITSATNDVRQLEMRMRQLEADMSTAQGEALDAVLAEYGDVSEQFDHLGGYDLEYRIDMVLNGLGVGQLDRDRPLSTLSGGEQARVGLALLLLSAPDLLLLDEPTNHLDASSLTWLEGYLQSYPGTMLLVSHDRQFLNNTANSILEIDEHTHAARQYSGNYDSYLAAKQSERRKWEQDYARQQEEIKQLQEEMKVTSRRNDNYRAHTDNDKFVINIKRATHDSTVSKRIRVAEERLARILENPIPQPPNVLRFHGEFDPDTLKKRSPLYASSVYKTFGGRQVLRDVSFTLGVDSRIVLVGPNGAGKSTLIRMLAGLEKPDSGEVSVSNAVKLGYLDQNQEQLASGVSLFEAFKVGLQGTDQQLKATLLQLGLLHYEDMEKPIDQASTGQRRKVQIARLLAMRANVLVLDEPTNHISFDVLEAFETALKAFQGPIIAASHDRRFIENFGGEVWELRDGHLLRHADGIEGYLPNHATMAGR